MAFDVFCLAISRGLQYRPLFGVSVGGVVDVKGVVDDGVDSSSGANGACWLRSILASFSLSSGCARRLCQTLPNEPHSGHAVCVDKGPYCLSTNAVLLRQKEPIAVLDMQQ